MVWLGSAGSKSCPSCVPGPPWHWRAGGSCTRAHQDRILPFSSSAFVPSPETPGQPESVSNSLGFPQTALTFSTGRSRCTSITRSYQPWVVSLLFISFPRHPAGSKQPGCDSPCSQQGIAVSSRLCSCHHSGFQHVPKPNGKHREPVLLPGGLRLRKHSPISQRVNQLLCHPVCSHRCLLHPQVLLPLTNPSRHRAGRTSALHKPPPVQPAVSGQNFPFCPLVFLLWP